MYHSEAIVRPMYHRKQLNLKSTPRGTAVTELAICLPLLVLITLGTVEACSMLYLQQKLETAAYEGSRVGCVPDATAANVRYQCETLLDAQSVNDYVITLNPSDPASLQQGEFLRVSIEAPCNTNSVIGGWFYMGRLLSGDASLSKE